jgi:peptide chain release factor 2
MHDIKQKITELNERVKRVKESFNLPEKQKKLNSLESDSMDPNLWDNQERARNLMKDLTNLKDEIDELNSLDEEISTLYSLSQESELSPDYMKDVTRLEKRLVKFELASFLSNPYDSKNAILSVHSGQGGTEAMDWANMLFRMYIRYFEKKGWKSETLELSEGEEAGIKSITLKVEGSYAYGFLKGEAGTHRLVRLSPFNADSLRQTSFALVEVLPELEETDLPDVKIKDEDLEWQFFRASSQGGQNVQKVSTAVRVIHNPTGIVVTAQTERFQEQNRKIALTLLRSKLWLLAQDKEKSQKKEIKGEYRPASWGNQIRSYVLHPYKMVKDVRTEVESPDPDSVLAGDLDEFIEAEIQGLHDNGK